MKELDDLNSLRQVIDWIFPTEEFHIAIQASEEDGVVLIVSSAAYKEKKGLFDSVWEAYGNDFKPMRPRMSKKELIGFVDRAIELLKPMAGEDWPKERVELSGKELLDYYTSKSH